MQKKLSHVSRFLPNSSHKSQQYSSPESAKVFYTVALLDNKGDVIHLGSLTVSCFNTRGVPIIGSADISATDMALFTNIGIGEKQHDDRYYYRYLYSSI